MGNLKWFGALIVLFVSTWIGWQFSDQLKQRPRQIRQFIDALTILEAEILYSQSSLQGAFLMIAKRLQEPSRTFFHRISESLFIESNDFVDLWNDQLKMFMSVSFLTDVDYEILRQFGQTLGQHDYEQQKKNIRLTITYLQRQREEAMDRANQYSKLTITLGFLLGLFIVLLLI